MPVGVGFFKERVTERPTASRRFCPDGEAPDGAFSDVNVTGHAIDTLQVRDAGVSLFKRPVGTGFFKERDRPRHRHRAGGRPPYLEVQHSCLPFEVDDVPCLGRLLPSLSLTSHGLSSTSRCLSSTSRCPCHRLSSGQANAAAYKANGANFALFLGLHFPHQPW